MRLLVAFVLLRGICNVRVCAWRLTRSAVQPDRLYSRCCYLAKRDRRFVSCFLERPIAASRMHIYLYICHRTSHPLDL